MKIQFLWDEEKTKRLHQQLLTLASFATLAAMIFSLTITGNDSKYMLFIISLTSLIYCLINLLLINKGNAGLRYLATLLFLELLIGMFMVYTGGFASVSQFGPFAVMLFAAFSLGGTATVIVVV
ncbi:MAG: hypothetical protein Q8Q06_00820, partial [bacterium]|nr:hypothetical protein [bacterium]